MERVLRIDNEVQSRPELIDILDGGYLFHWAPIEKLPKILTRGIYTAEFAKRIRDSKFEQNYPGATKKVCLVNDPRVVWGGLSIGRKANEVIAVIVEDISGMGRGTSGRPFVEWDIRVPPRLFVGLTIADELIMEKFGNSGAFEDVVGKVNSARSVIQRPGRVFSIYGSSGAIYWPERMSHVEILRMLKVK